jgi:hypothetical protein
LANDHQAFTHFPRQGFRRQIELSWQPIRKMHHFDLAIQVNLPTAQGRGEL